MLRGFPQEVLLRLLGIRQRFCETCRRLRVFHDRFRRRLRVELIFADQRRVDPRQLMVSGLLPNVVSNSAHDRVDGHPGVVQMSEKRRRKGTVLAGRAIEGGALRVAGECDQRAARQVAVDGGQSALDDERSRLLPGKHRREGIVAASTRMTMLTRSSRFICFSSNETLMAFKSRSVGLLRTISVGTR